MPAILSQKIGAGTTRTCSSTCHMARKEKCACICGSKFHGLGFRPKDVDEAKAKAQERFHEKEFCAEKDCTLMGVPDKPGGLYICPDHHGAYYALVMEKKVEAGA